MVDSCEASNGHIQARLTGTPINDKICIIHFIYYTFKFVYWSFKGYFIMLLCDEWLLKNSGSEEHASSIMFVIRAWSLLPGVCFSFDRGSAAEEQLLFAFSAALEFSNIFLMPKRMSKLYSWSHMIYYIQIFRLPVIAWALPVQRFVSFVKILGLGSIPPGEV